jgi:hypothetical protein
MIYASCVNSTNLNTIPTKFHAVTGAQLTSSVLQTEAAKTAVTWDMQVGGYEAHLCVHRLVPHERVHVHRCGILVGVVLWRWDISSMPSRPVRCAACIYGAKIQLCSS